MTPPGLNVETSQNLCRKITRPSRLKPLPAFLRLLMNK